MTNIPARVVLLALALLVTGRSNATKPCLPSPCEVPGAGFAAEKCKAAAAWVATGTISEVVRHPQGPPLSKDFAEFTFTVQAWEKGQVSGVTSMRLQVGWCESPVPLPANTQGQFRFYGSPAPTTKDEPWQYLYFTGP